VIVRRLSALAALAVVGLASCTSLPSNRTVTEEMIETLEGVSQDVKDCMSAKLENYTDDELEQIGDQNPDFTSMDPTMTMTPELQAFITDLSECNDNPSAADTATTDTATTDGTVTDSTVTDSTSTGDTTATTLG